MKQNLAVCFISFNRPQYFGEVVESVKHQTDTSNIDYYCFQDGAINKFSGIRYSDQDKIDQCIKIFKKAFPKGELHYSKENIGIEINYNRAEEYLYNKKGYDYVLWCEDDTVLHPTYFETMKAMIKEFGKHPKIGMFNAFGENKAPLKDQIKNHNSIKEMVHQWAYCMPKDKWEIIQQDIKIYSDYMNTVDYRLRDNKWIYNNIFPKINAKKKSTSGDSVRTVTMLNNGLMPISTYTNNAAYIGKLGVHGTPEFFNKMFKGMISYTKGPVLELKFTDKNLEGIRKKLLKKYMIREGIVGWLDRINSNFNYLSVIYSPDAVLGIFSIFLKNNLPRVYYLLKNK